VHEDFVLGGRRVSRHDFEDIGFRVLRCWVPPRGIFGVKCLLLKSQGQNDEDGRVKVNRQADTRAKAKRGHLYDSSDTTSSFIRCSRAITSDDGALGAEKVLQL
jgi:hypothetical protein